MTSQGMMDSDSNPCGVPSSTAAIEYERRIINPFIHELHFTNWHRFKILLGGLILLPLRIMVALIFMGLASLLANISLCFMSLFKLNETRRLKCRQFLKPPCIFILRSMFFLGGFYRPRILDQNGKKVSKDSIEAPIICLAPHSSLFDILPYIMLGAPAVVAKNEARFTPLMGSVLLLSEPILVNRESKASRTETIQAINHKARDLNDKILIFPEGTCTNRSSLIQFKLGAFIPGLPVQPVAIRYHIPPEIDDLTWTWEGPGAVKLLLYSLCRWKTDMDIIILPAYHPSAQEKSDPQLFAANVRNVIARYLQIPISYYSYDDVRFLKFVSTWEIPKSPACLKLVKLCDRIMNLESQGAISEQQHACEVPTATIQSTSNGMSNGSVITAPLKSYGSTSSLISCSSSSSSSHQPQPQIFKANGENLRQRNSPVHDHKKTVDKGANKPVNGQRVVLREGDVKSDSSSDNKDDLSQLTLNDLVNFINKLAHDISLMPQGVQIKSKEDLIHVLRIAHCSKIGNSTSVQELYLCLSQGGQTQVRAKDLLILCTLCDARIESLWDRIEMAIGMMANGWNDTPGHEYQAPCITVHQFQQLVWYLLGFNEISEDMLSQLSQEQLTFERFRQLFLGHFAPLIRQNAPSLLTGHQYTSIGDQDTQGSNSDAAIANVGHDNMGFTSEVSHIIKPQQQQQSNHFTQVQI